MDNIDFTWSDEKNKLLKTARNVCFEDVVTCIDGGKLLDIVRNPSANRDEQYCLIVDIGHYAFVVPFVKNERGFFLKTIYPSRKQTKKYLKEK